MSLLEFLGENAEELSKLKPHKDDKNIPKLVLINVSNMIGERGNGNGSTISLNKILLLFVGVILIANEENVSLENISRVDVHQIWDNNIVHLGKTLAPFLQKGSITEKEKEINLAEITTIVSELLAVTGNSDKDAINYILGTVLEKREVV